MRESVCRSEEVSQDENSQDFEYFLKIQEILDNELSTYRLECN